MSPPVRAVLRAGDLVRVRILWRRAPAATGSMLRWCRHRLRLRCRSPRPIGGLRGAFLSPCAEARAGIVRQGRWEYRFRIIDSKFRIQNSKNYRNPLRIRRLGPAIAHHRRGFDVRGARRGAYVPPGESVSWMTGPEPVFAVWSSRRAGRLAMAGFTDPAGSVPGSTVMSIELGRVVGRRGFHS